MDDFYVLRFLQLGGHEYIDTERRRNRAHAKIYQNDAGHLNLIDAICIGNGSQQGNKQQDRGVAVDEHAADNEQHIDNQQEHDGRADILRDQGYQLLRNAGESDEFL